jgi:pimeloyl-ACP methyl ester carboxylesterase
MPTFSSHDDTLLAYDVHGADDGSAPLVCIPGGAMRDPVYLGDLGGLAAARRLVVLHLRGTGGSAAPAEPATWRWDRQVADLEALRVHLGLERLDLLAHSAGAAIALRYAGEHPDRVGHLTLVTPSLRVLDLAPTPEDRAQARALRAREPWFAQASAAAERIDADEDGASDEDWAWLAHFSHGRWDEEIAEFERASDGQYNWDAAGAYYAPGGPDAQTVKAGLAALDAPVLILVGEYDSTPRPRAAERAADCFRNARVIVAPGAGHFPWLDDAAGFVRLVTGR